MEDVVLIVVLSCRLHWRVWVCGWSQGRENCGWTEWLNGRLNNCGVISPRFDVGVKEIEGWTARLLPSCQVSYLQLKFAVWLHRADYICWHHGPWGSQAEECWWQSSRLLVRRKFCMDHQFFFCLNSWRHGTYEESSCLLYCSGLWYVRVVEGSLVRHQNEYSLYSWQLYFYQIKVWCFLVVAYHQICSFNSW